MVVLFASLGCDATVVDGSSPLFPSPQPDPVLVTVFDVAGPVVGAVVAFNDPDGTPGLVTLTDDAGLAGAFVPDGSTLTVIVEPDAVTIFDVRRGEQFVLRPPDQALGAQVRAVAPVTQWPGADRYEVSFGCGNTALPVGGAANDGALWECRDEPPRAALATAAASGGPLLATAFTTEVDDAGTVVLPAWEDALVMHTLDIVPFADALAHEGDLIHAVRLHDRWFGTHVSDARLYQADFREVAVGPAGVVDAMELVTELRFDRTVTTQVVRQPAPAPPFTLDAEALRPALDARYDFTTDAVHVTRLRPVANEIAVHAKLWFETRDHDEPPARWDLLARPGTEVFAIPEVPSSVSQATERRLRASSVRLIAGTLTDPDGWRATFAATAGDPARWTASDDYVLTTFRDEALRD